MRQKAKVESCFRKSFTVPVGLHWNQVKVFLYKKNNLTDFSECSVYVAYLYIEYF
jgi:hypothetical protein